MITSRDLQKIPVFADVEEQGRRRLARRAADLYLEPGDWLIREGEEPRFFVVLEGELEAIKDIVGQSRVVGRSVPGEFSGETPIFMGTASIVSVRAVTKCRVARFHRVNISHAFPGKHGGECNYWATHPPLKSETTGFKKAYQFPPLEYRIIERRARESWSPNWIAQLAVAKARRLRFSILGIFES